MSLYTFHETDGSFCINWSCFEKVRVKVRVRVNPYFDDFFIWSCFGNALVLLCLVMVLT
jgi:hypothetical protein